MRDKNDLAEKLNHLNELEINLHDKEKEIKAEQLYLKKQWEELNEAKKDMDSPKETKPKPSVMRSSFFPSNVER